MNTTNKPAHVVRCGNVKATCWLNSTQAGYFYNTTINTPALSEETTKTGIQ